MRRISRLAAASCVAMAALLPLAGCAPPGKAVGDTQEREPKVAYDGMDRPDATFGMIGSANGSAVSFDTVVLDALDASDIHVSYVSLQGVDDQTAAAQDGVRDMVQRVVDAIIVSDIDVTDRTAGGWNDALGLAREAGVPVVLLNPTSIPDDRLLYAAVFNINDRDAGAVPIDDALMRVADDRPHGKTMQVTTKVD